MSDPTRKDDAAPSASEGGTEAATPKAPAAGVSPPAAGALGVAASVPPSLALGPRERDGPGDRAVRHRLGADPRDPLPARGDARAHDAHDAVLPLRAPDDGGREAGGDGGGAAGVRGRADARCLEPRPDARSRAAGLQLLTLAGPPAGPRRPRG